MRAWLGRSLISTAFARIMIGQIISVTGSNATAVVIPLIAVITLNASPFEVGVLNAAESLAAAVLGMRIGRWCDRIGPDKTMLASNLIGATATGLLFLTLYTRIITFPMLVTLMLFVGISTLGFDIARTGYTVALVPKGRLPHANALLEGANALGEGIGPSLGGWLLATVGATWSMLLDFVTYVCSSTLVLLNVREHCGKGISVDAVVAAQGGNGMDHTSDTGGSSSTPSTGARIYWQGLRFVWRNGIIRSIAFSAGHFNFFTAAFFTVYYVFVVRDLHMDPVSVGLAATCSGVAGIVSATVAAQLMRHVAAGPLFVFSLLSPAVAAMLVPLSATLSSVGHPLVVAVVCLSQFSWSFTVTVNVILSESIKQVSAPEHLLGRVSSVERVIALTAEPIGALAGGLVAGITGSGPTLYLCAAGLAASVLWATGKTGIMSFRQPSEWRK